MPFIISLSFGTNRTIFPAITRKTPTAVKTVNTAKNTAVFFVQAFFGLLGVDGLAVGVILRILEKLCKHKVTFALH